MSGVAHYITETRGVDLAAPESRPVTRHAVGDDLETLVREHARLVFRIAYSVTRNHADAEDVVQEVFLRVAKHGAKGIEDQKAWISRIAWRAAVDRHRCLARAEHENFDESLYLGGEPIGRAEQEVRSREMLAVVDRLIDTLPSKERDALLLTSLQELSTAEAARLLGTTQTSVRARVFRARRRLIEKLQKLTGIAYGK